MEENSNVQLQELKKNTRYLILEQTKTKSLDVIK